PFGPVMRMAWIPRPAVDAAPRIAMEPGPLWLIRGKEAGKNCRFGSFLPVARARDRPSPAQKLLLQQ
ncbi:MAG TPA: hypothetical protein VFF05_08490, partial [Rudaea sp.]|nr:hypothetical protein [Rudaea sp.]